MRLQSAIFTLDDTLFTPDGAAREGLDKALSLFKMEGVWLGAVTALSAEDAQKALEKAGLHSLFPLRADRIRRALQGGQRHDVRARDEAPALAKGRYDRLFPARLRRSKTRRTRVFAPWRCREVRARRTGRRCSNSPRRALRSTANCWQILCEFWKSDRIRRFLVAVFLNCDIVRI